MQSKKSLNGNPFLTYSLKVSMSSSRVNDHVVRCFCNRSDVGESIVSVSIIVCGFNIVGEIMVSNCDRTASVKFEAQYEFMIILKSNVFSVTFD